jgi:predicted ester cyclase
MSTTTESNVKTVHSFLDEVVNNGRAELVDEFMAPDYVMHGGSLGEYDGRDAYQKFLAANAAGAFTGMRLDVEQTLSDGDLVHVLFTNSGTNTGPFMGNAPTGRYAKWHGTVLFRLTDGRIVESTYVEDILDMLTQLGVLQALGG